MAKKRVRPAKSAPAYITRPGTKKRPYGVTAADNRKIIAARVATNRVFELETALNAARLEAATYEAMVRTLADLPVTALSRLCATPVSSLVAAGIDVSLVTEVTLWLERRGKLVKP